MNRTASSDEAGEGRHFVRLWSYPSRPRGRSHVLLRRSLQAAPLIGREDDLALVSGLLNDPSVRLVTLTGRSGVGKTRLALEVAWALDADRPGSVGVVSLGSVNEPELIFSEIAAQLHAAMPPGLAVAAALIRWLDRSPTVLVLDNFEHLVRTADLLNDLIDACDDLQLLVTSQAPLRLQAERVVRLAPLPLPEDRRQDASDVIEQPAVALYCNRARAVNHQFRLTADNLAAVVALCRQLEGLPLAIELAAARAVTVPAEDLLTRLSEHRLDVLRSVRTDAPARHQDLRAAIGWTYQLLSPSERDLLRRLSVIGGPFDVDDVEALDSKESADVLDGLSSLVDLHLLEAVSERGVANFELRPSVREFAREELIASGDFGALEGRWAGWLAGRARSAARGLHQTDPDKWWNWLEGAHDRLLTALQRCVDTERVEEALDLVAGLAPLWVNRTLEQAHSRLIDRTIEMAEHQGRETGPLAEAWVWSALLGIRVLAPDDPQGFLERLRRGEALARALHDEEQLLRALDCWARVAPMTSEDRRAAAALSEGIALAGRRRETCWLAGFEVQMARYFSGSGDDDRALTVVLSGLAHARQMSDSSTVLQAAQLLQTMAPGYPAAAEAMPPLQEVLEMARSTHQTAIEAVLLATLATQAVARGELNMAAGWCRRCLELSGLVPSSYLVGYGVFAAVEIAAVKGDKELAARLHGRLLDSERRLYAAMQPHFVAAHSTTIDSLRNALGTDGFATRVAEGSRLAWPAVFRELEAYLGAIESPEPTASTVKSGGRSQSRTDGLTDRQAEVVRLLARGLTNKEIARLLGLSQKTVMHHTVAIYQKIGVRGRSETIAWAIRTGVAVERA